MYRAINKDTGEVLFEDASLTTVVDWTKTFPGLAQEFITIESDEVYLPDPVIELAKAISLVTGEDSIEFVEKMNLVNFLKIMYLHWKEIKDDCNSPSNSEILGRDLSSYEPGKGTACIKYL